jgi:hypothetical protein
VPKLKLGAVVYGLVAIALFAGIVLMLRNVGPYADVRGGPRIATVIVVGASGVLLAIGAVTRRGLVSDDGPWICRNGWILLAGVTCGALVVAAVSSQDVNPFPTGPAVFLPHFIRRLQESYYDGVAEAEQALTATPDGESQPRS